MRLQDCNLDVDPVFVPPVEHTEPQPPWIELRDAGIIPESLYQFYCTADYFSFSRAPAFLADDNHLLFGILKHLVEATRDHIRSSLRQKKTIEETRDTLYTPVKKARGEKWDPDASNKQEDAFRLLLLNLASCLDIAAEITSLFLPGLNPNLRLGRASMTDLNAFLVKEREIDTSIVVPPEQHFADQLHTALRPLFVGEGQEDDWFKLFTLYRNKLTHIGASGLLHKINLHDDEGRFYTFLPNRWPFVHESHLTSDDEETPESMPDFLITSLIHQDLVEYSERLYRRMWDIVERASEVFREAYVNLSDLPLRQKALDDLDRNRQEYAFRAFL